MINYTGKIVFVGIDVHKKTYAVTAICDGEIVKKDTLKASPEELESYLTRYFVGADIRTVYEAGFSGFVLHRHLTKAGIKNIVVHAASVEVSARDRVKTDKRDSLKLALQLAAGRLRCIYIPSPEREAYREVTRLREKLTLDKRRIGNRLKGLLLRHGLLGREDNEAISLKWLKQIEKLNCHQSIQFTILSLTMQWRALREQIKKVDSELAAQAKADEKLDKVYQSAPGIGKIHARVLANELEGLWQFTNEKQAFSFTGLTPCEYSSGEHKRQGHISRQGRSLLRKVLVQAAWVAIKQDLSLFRIFERLSKQCGKKRAIVGIARRLIGRIRSCFRNNTLYQIEKVDLQTGEILQVSKS